MSYSNNNRTSNRTSNRSSDRSVVSDASVDSFIKSKTGKRLNSYILFAKHERDNVREAYPDINFEDMGKELGRRWNSLPEDDKEEYRRLSRGEVSTVDEHDNIRATRRPSSYILFSKEQSKILKRKDPYIDVDELTTIIGEKWNNLTDYQRKKYQRLADEEWANYRSEQDDEENEDAEEEEEDEEELEQRQYQNFAKEYKKKNPSVKNESEIKKKWSSMSLSQKSKYDPLSNINFSESLTEEEHKILQNEMKKRGLSYYKPRHKKFDTVVDLLRLSLKINKSKMSDNQLVLNYLLDSDIRTKVSKYLVITESDNDRDKYILENVVPHLVQKEIIVDTDSLLKFINEWSLSLVEQYGMFSNEVLRFLKHDDKFDFTYLIDDCVKEFKDKKSDFYLDVIKTLMKNEDYDTLHTIVRNELHNHF